MSLPVTGKRCREENPGEAYGAERFRTTRFRSYSEEEQKFKRGLRHLDSGVVAANVGKPPAGFNVNPGSEGASNQIRALRSFEATPEEHATSREEARPG